MEAIETARQLLAKESPELRRAVGELCDEIERATFDWCSNLPTVPRTDRYECARAYIRELQAGELIENKGGKNEKF